VGLGLSSLGPAFVGLASTGLRVLRRPRPPLLGRAQGRLALSLVTTVVCFSGKRA